LYNTNSSDIGLIALCNSLYHIGNFKKLLYGGNYTADESGQAILTWMKECDFSKSIVELDVHHWSLHDGGWVSKDLESQIL
jgi:hypothetical protein